MFTSELLPLPSRIFLSVIQFLGEDNDLGLSNIFFFPYTSCLKTESYKISGMFVLEK